MKKMIKKYFYSAAIFLAIGFVTQSNINPSFADPINSMGAPLLGHKRHPEHDPQGLKISGDVTGVTQGLINNDDGADTSDTSDVSYSADLFFEFPIPAKKNSFVSLHLEMGQGTGITDSAGDSFGGPNGDLGYDNGQANISEAFYEATYFDTLLTLTFGKVDPTAYFDGNDVANDETQQFLAGEFVNNAAVEFTDYGLGLRFSVDPVDFLNVSFGAFEGDSDFNNVFDRLFYIGEVGFKANIGKLPGNYRLYLWQNNTRHEKISNELEGDTNWGVGFSLDQYVTDSIELFARFGMQNEEVSEYNIAESFGIEIHGDLFGRPDDVFSIAYGLKHTGDDYETANGISSTEGYFEAFYSVAMHETFHISPDFQFITNPKGDGNRDNLYIYGVRAQVDF